MIRRQVERVRQKILRQSQIVFGKKERRTRSTKRQFIDSIIDGQEATKDREVAALIVTYTISRLKELYYVLGEDEVYNVIFEKEIKPV